MTTRLRFIALGLLFSVLVSAQNKSFTPRWFAKYQTLLQNGIDGSAPKANSINASTNVYASNEFGPQCETFISVNTVNSNSLSDVSSQCFLPPTRGCSSPG